MIETIAFAVAALGLVAAGIAHSMMRQMQREVPLKQHRSKQPALADLLNYAAVVDDGIIVNKNGSLMAAWLYRGQDAASCTELEQEAVAARINRVLTELGNGWMLHVDAVRRPAPDYPDRAQSHFQDRVSAAMDEERRRLFEELGTMYEGYFVLTLTWFPPRLAESRFVELMFDDDRPQSAKASRTVGLLDKFKRDIGRIEANLGLQMTRLRGHRVANEDGSESTLDDFLSWLQFCVTGIREPMRLPDQPAYLDAMLGGQELWGGVVPKIGRNFVQVLAIEGFPQESTPGILKALAEQPCEYRWSSRFIFMEPIEAEKHLKRFRQQWTQKVRGFVDQLFNTHSGRVDQDAISMVADADAALQDSKSGVVAFGYYTSVVVLMHEDRDALAAAASLLEKGIRSCGFAARVETLNTLDAFFGSLPGHGVENVRRPLIHTLNLADMLPTSSLWTGHAVAPCPMYPPDSPALMHCVAVGATPFRLNLHVQDVGHTFIAGPTGGGKSTLLGMLVAQYRRYPGVSIYFFDKGYSSYALTKAVGGQHYAVAADELQLAFCPLQFLQTRADRAWAMEWINTILALNGLQTTPAQRGEIGSAVLSMHASGARTMSEFTLTVQDEAIREVLRHYTVDGPMGQLVDASEDGLALADFTTFEMGELIALDDKYALPVLLYLFRRIEASLKGQPAVIVVDEAWMALGHPVFRAKVREWLKVLRKLNCAVVLATQSLTDAKDSGILDVLLESTASKIFLPNPNARSEEAKELYQTMGLNTRQIDLLAQAAPKRQYYYVSTEGRRLYEMALGPLALALVGASDQDSLREIRRLEDTHAEAWIDAWLAQKGLRLADYEEAA